MNPMQKQYKPQVQSKRAVNLSHKIIALHKRLVDAGKRPPRLDVKFIQVAGSNQLTGLYSSLLEYGRGVE